MWKSADGGSTWGESSPGDDVEVVETVVSPTGAVYALASSGMGRAMVEAGPLFASTDHGHSWQAVSTPEQRTSVGVLEFDRGGRLYAGAQRGDVAALDAGLYISRDGAVTWEWKSVSPGLHPVSSGVDALMVSDDYPTVMLAHLQTWSSTFVRGVGRDLGWMEVLSNSGTYLGRASVYPVIRSDPVMRGVCYAVERRVYRSVDHGMTWGKLGEGLPEASYETGRMLGGLAIGPGDDPCLYTAADDRVVCLCDGDVAWRDCGAVEMGCVVYSLASHPRAPGRLYACTSRGLFASEDGATSWEALLRPGMGMWSSGRLRFGGRDPGRAFVITGSSLYDSRDAGMTWQDLAAAIAGRPWVTDVAEDPYGRGQLLVATSQGVYRLPTEEPSTVVRGEMGPSPWRLRLDQNYPNPFNSSTAITFAVPERGDVRLAVYNLMGQKVRTLARGEWNAGEHQLLWTGRDDHGRRLASGVYVCCLQVGDLIESRKLLLIR